MRRSAFGRGEFSERILSYTAPRELHLIDPWLFQPQYPRRMYGGRVAGDQQVMDRIYENVAGRLGSLDNVTVHRTRSAHALPLFDDGYFDWVYIDGDHSFQTVLADLQLCMAKVKPGGIIAGDDFTWGPDEGYPVQRAVTEFVQRHGLTGNLNRLGSQFVIQTEP